MKVLLFIEDDPAVRSSLARALRAHYIVIEAPTLKAAEAYLLEGVPDAILSDYDLPDGDAPSLLARWNLPTVYHTGRNPLTLSGLGYTVLQKPAPMGALFNALERVTR